MTPNLGYLPREKLSRGIQPLKSSVVMRDIASLLRKLYSQNLAWASIFQQESTQNGRYFPKDGSSSALLAGLGIPGDYPKTSKFAPTLPKLWFAFLTCIHFCVGGSGLNTSSKMKAILRMLKISSRDLLDDAIVTALDSVSIPDITNWFAHDGYCLR